MTVTRKYYWILTKDLETGKPYLIRGDYDEATARQKGLEILGGLDFELRLLPTTNMSTASAMIRGARLEETHSLARARQRLGHERSLDKMKKRIEGRRRSDV